MGLERQQSYNYRGWNEVSSSKKKVKSPKMVNFGSVEEEQKPESSKTLYEKQNVLSEIDNFLEENEIPLPPPLRRLSLEDYSPILTREGSAFLSSD